MDIHQALELLAMLINEHVFTGSVKEVRNAIAAVDTAHNVVTEYVQHTTAELENYAALIAKRADEDAAKLRIAKADDDA